MNKKVIFLIFRWVFALAAVAVIIIQRGQISDLSDKAAHAPKRAASNRPAGSPSVQAQLAQALALNNPDLARILAMPDRFERLRALLDFTQGLNAKDLATVLQRMASEENTMRGDNSQAMSILMARLAQLDPKGALEWANSELKGTARRQVLDLLFDAWSSLDPTAALAGLDKIRNVSERSAFERSALSNLAMRDPKAALKILQNLPGAEQTRANYAAIFTTWAANDPMGAAAGVLAMPPSRNRDLAVEDMLQGWAMVDPRGALTWAANLPGGVRAGALSTALGNLAQQDPQAAVEYLNSLTSPTDRNNLLGTVAANWGKVDATAAITWVEENATGQAHDSAVLTLLGQLSQTDPLQASKLIDRLPPQMQTQAITRVADNWAMQDIKSAMDWIGSQPLAQTNPGQFKNIEVDMINNLANVDPARAASYVETIQDNPLFRRLVEQVAANWVGADPPAAFAWAKSLPYDSGGYNAMLQVITQYTNKDAPAAWDMATNLPPGDLRDNSMTNVFGKWVTKNPAQAAPLLADLPEKSQATSTNALARAWLVQDPQSAEKWINTLPAGSSRDAAVTQIIAVEGPNDLPTAYTWAATIGDDTARFNQIRQVILQWSRTDPNAAAAATQSANISDTQRQSLINLLQGSPGPRGANGG